MSPLSLIKGLSYSCATTAPFIITGWKMLGMNSITSPKMLFMCLLARSICFTAAYQLRIVSTPPLLCTLTEFRPLNTKPLTVCSHEISYNLLTCDYDSSGNSLSSEPPKPTFSSLRKMSCSCVISLYHQILAWLRYLPDLCRFASILFL